MMVHVVDGLQNHVDGTTRDLLRKTSSCETVKELATTRFLEHEVELDVSE